MEIKDFINKKKEFDCALLGLISEEIRKFKNETGMSPCKIDIEFIEATGYGDDLQQFEIIELDTKYKLFSWQII